MKRLELKPGQDFRTYEISKEIGRGGVSIVYEGFYDYADGFTNPDYAAFKIFSPDRRFSDVTRLRLRFKFEQWITYRFLFRRLLTGGWGKENDILYIKYDRVADSDLKGLIRNGAKSYSVPTILSHMINIVLGVSFLHANGFIHRDLKPSNILIIGNDAIVADFGIARDLDKQYVEDTRTDDIMGSRDYIAPEQRNNPRRATQLSDIYSLGVIFYEMVTKRLPTYRFVPIGDLDKRFAFLDSAILRMLAADPSERQPTVRHVLYEILGAWTRDHSLPTVHPLVFYPFKAILFAKKLLQKKQADKVFSSIYKYEIHHVEDLLAYTYYWLNKPYTRLTKIHTPTLHELKLAEPELVMEPNKAEEELVYALINEIDRTLSDNHILNDWIGDPITEEEIESMDVF